MRKMKVECRKEIENTLGYKENMDGDRKKGANGSHHKRSNGEKKERGQLITVIKEDKRRVTKKRYGWKQKGNPTYCLQGKL